MKQTFINTDNFCDPYTCICVKLRKKFKLYILRRNYLNNVFTSPHL